MHETFRLKIRDQFIEYRLIGEPRRMRGGKSRYFEQRFRVLGQKKRTISLRTSDKRVASRRAQQMVEERIQQIRGGGGLHASSITLKHYLRGFLADLKADGCSAKHVHGNKEHHLLSILDHFAWTDAAQICGSMIKGYLAHRRDAGEIGWQTTIHYLASIKSFSRWLVLRGHIDKDPLATMKPEPRGDTPRVVHRRAFTDAEMKKLVANANGSAKVVRRLTGRWRAILYLTARFSGLRAQELASLTPAHLHLNVDPPVLKIDRQVSKRRRYDRIVLSPEMADLLDSLAAGQDQPMWPGRWWDRAAEMMRTDMDGIEEENGQGILQFHSLRHTHVGDVVRTGASIAEILRICRLSTPALLDRYYHSHAEEQRVISLKLPKPELPS